MPWEPLHQCSLSRPPFPSVRLGCETLPALAIPWSHDPEAANCALQSVIFGSYSSFRFCWSQDRFSPITDRCKGLRQDTGEMSKSKRTSGIVDFSSRSARINSCISFSFPNFPQSVGTQEKRSLLRFLDRGPEVERRLAPGTSSLNLSTTRKCFPGSSFPIPPSPTLSETRISWAIHVVKSSNPDDGLGAPLPRKRDSSRRVGDVLRYLEVWISRHFVLEPKITHVERVEQELSCQSATEAETTTETQQGTEQVRNRIVFYRLNVCNSVLKKNVCPSCLPFWEKNFLSFPRTAHGKKKKCSALWTAAQSVAILAQSVATAGVITAALARVRSYVVQGGRAVGTLSTRPESWTFFVMRWLFSLGWFAMFAWEPSPAGRMSPKRSIAAHHYSLLCDACTAKFH